MDFDSEKNYDKCICDDFVVDLESVIQRLKQCLRRLKLKELNIFIIINYIYIICYV